jgi:hypothetical protein
MGKPAIAVLGLVAVLALFVSANAEVFFEENFEGADRVCCARMFLLI